jgi:hypothetical protein
MNKIQALPKNHAQTHLGSIFECHPLQGKPDTKVSGFLFFRIVVFTLIIQINKNQFNAKHVWFSL